MEQKKVSWSTIMETNTERKFEKMRAPALIAVVVILHAMAISTVMFMQGCGTKQAAVEPPPAPVMPPKAGVVTPPTLTPPPPVFHPAPVAPAPSMGEAEGQTYIVQNGDSLSKIASRCGVSSKEIAELNGIKDFNKVRVGQKLVLPAYAKVLPSAPAKKTSTAAKPKVAAKAPASAPVAEGNVYVVQAGDQLGKIAKKYGVKVSSLRETNHLKSDMIQIGQKLVIPGARPAESVQAIEQPVVEPAPPAESAPAPVEITPVPAPSPVPAPVATTEVKPEIQDQPLDYTVQDGDTLDDIAKLFIVRKEDIMTLNGLSEPATVKPGQKIKIPSSPQ